METIIKKLIENRTTLNEGYGTNAWHLRQDGKAFPVSVHLYCEGDEDLSSEAECSSFIIKTNSKDKEYAEYVLDAWMAFLIEENVSYDADENAINQAISESLKHLPYKFPYPLSESELLSIHKKSGNYKDIDTLYDFIDFVRDKLEEIQETIKKSMNQQFCRVRYGGLYDTSKGNSEIWFRISSEGYNWANTIYEFVSNQQRTLHLSHITICRDMESDDTEKEYFYKAKDGAYYKHMPIEEFLAEEHEHSLVFDSVDIKAGVLNSVWKLLERGYTYLQVKDRILSEGVELQKDYKSYLLRKERIRNCSQGERRSNGSYN